MIVQVAGNTIAKDNRFQDSPTQCKPGQSPGDLTETLDRALRQNPHYAFRDITNRTVDPAKIKGETAAPTAVQQSAELTKLMNELVIPLYALRARRKGYEVSAMKAMMDMIGLAGGPVRPPLVDLRPDEIKSLQATMERWHP